MDDTGTCSGSPCASTLRSAARRERSRALTSFDRLYLGGGNARKIDFVPDPDVTIVGNEAGIEGGVGLWRAARPHWTKVQ